MHRRDAILGAGAAAALAGVGAWGWRSTVGPSDLYTAYARRLRAPLPAEPAAEDLVRFASLAANGHNTQPWRFRVEPQGISLLPDHARETPVVDPDNHHLFVSLGCAAENLLIAGTAAGPPGVLESLEGGGVRYVASPGAARPDPLVAAIPQRQSTRAVYEGGQIAPAELEALQRAAALPGVRAVLLTDRGLIGKVRDLVVAGNSVQMADPAFMAELTQWVRFNPRSAMASGDGLFAAASGSPVLPDALGRVAFDRFVTAGGENDKYARQIDSSSGVAIFLAERADAAHWITVGRACQRFALTATALGLKHAFINQPVEVARYRPALAALAGEPGLRPDILMRFGRGPQMPFAPRRPTRAVMA